VDLQRGAGPVRPDVIADALHLPFGEATVDTVLATELMEHVQDSDAFMAEVGRVLRNDGTLILSVPFMEPIHEEPRDFYRFTAYGLQALLARHGLAACSIEQKGGWWSVLGSFVSQSLYEAVRRRFHGGGGSVSVLTKAIVIPICASAQVLGYCLDKIFKSTRYTLGYVLVARRTG
jgi:SAM-dependent methyltransferase